MTEELLEEIKRKIGRLIVGTLLIVIIVYLKNRYDIELARNVSFFLVLFAIFQDFLRIDLKFKIPFYDSLLIRPTEKAGLHGSTLALIGCLLTITFFDFDIALAAAAMYLYGDASACIIGKGFGKIKLHDEKKLEGSAAMFLAAVIMGFVFLNNIFLIAGMALFATLLELFITKIPDDLVLPIFTALAGQFLSAPPPLKVLKIALISWLLIVTALFVFLGSLAFYKKLKR